MIVRKLASLIACAAVALIVTACSSGGDSSKPVTPDQAPVKGTPDANAAQGSSYRIQPPDKNDPRFKADPKLAGGN